MKNPNYHQANQMEQSNILMSFKRSNYKQKRSLPGYSIQYHDLSWIQINGYQPKMNKVAQLQMKGTSFQRIEVMKAKRQFYSVAMACMMIAFWLIASAF